MHWQEKKQGIQQLLVKGEYRLEPLVLFRHDGGGTCSYWGSLDAVILKAISIALTSGFTSQNEMTSYQMKGRGGLKGAVRAVKEKIGEYHFVLKSDIASYYASMDHEIVMQQCREVITDDVILQMIYQYLTRLEIFDGEYRLVTKGIPKGCSLSPIIGAIMLKALDKALGNKYFYIRYMDDWIVFTKTRWELREAVKITHSVIKELKFKLAVDKTYIGRIDKGFDFLGYRFNRQGIIGLADKTVGNFLEHRAKLYEQGAPDQRIREYVRRWVSWVNAGLA